MDSQKKLYATNKKENHEAAAMMQRDIDSVNKKIKLQEQYIKGLRTSVDSLSKASYKDLAATVKALNRELRSGAVKRGSAEWDAMAKKIRLCRQEMKKYEDATRAQMPMWKNFFNFLNTNWGAIVQITASLTGLTMTVRKSVNAFAEMDQEMANVRKYTGQSADEVERMNEDFKKMDTRTAREQLNQLAGAAGRLGITATDAVEEFVDAADKIGVALGDDLGEGAVDSIGKLAMAFGEDEKMGLRGAMLATGSAINELAQNSSAKAGYLVDFTARVAGFGKQLGLTQAQIMGFGAVMDENLLREEMSATAFGNMLTKMQTDTEKFAKIAGMSVKEFTKLIGEDANGAVLRLADSLRAQDPQTMMKMLDDMGLDGSRAVGVLSTLADKIDDVRDRQELATKAYRDGTSVIKEFDIQNNTVQAGLDKAKKNFNELTIELGKKLLPIVKYTITSTGLLVKTLSTIADFVYRNTKEIIALGIAIGGYTLAVNSATIATKAWVLITKATPWGLWAAGLTLVLSLVDKYKRSVDKARKSSEELYKVEQDATKQYSEESREIKKLNSILRDETKSIDERKDAIERIKKIIPEYNGMLDEEGRLTRDNKKAIDDYLVSLEKQIRLKAYQTKLEELYNRQAEQEEAQREASDAYWKERQTNTLQGQRNSGAGKLMDFLGIGEEASLKRALDAADRDLADTNDKIETIEKKISEVGVLANKMAEDKGGSGGTGGSGAAGGYTSGKNNSKEETERRKRLHKAVEDAKAAYQAQLAEEMLAYRQGITTYGDYMEERHNLTQNYYNRLKKIYGEDSAEYRKLLEQEYYAWQQKMSEQALSKQRFEREMAIQRQYWDESNQLAYQNDEVLKENLFQSEIEYLKQRQNLYKQGSKEWLEIEDEIEKQMLQHKFDLEKDWNQRLLQYRKEAGLMNYQQMMEVEMRGVESFFGALLKAGKMTQEEYDRIIEHIRMKYADLAANQAEDSDTRNRASKALGTARKAAGANGVTPGDNAATGINAIFSAVEQQKMVNEQLKQLYGEDYANNEEYQEAKRQLDLETMQDIVAGAQAAYSTISQLMSAASSYAQACSDLEVARVTANYDKQIEAAGNNAKKREKLEKEKDEKIRKAKTKANKKAMNMELAQAIAQTALGAISAYMSTMEGAPYPANLVLAPISAGIALAAGALQIATIKKQHQAEEAGYYEGGYTGGHRYRKKAGVVHEGEFVANHQAVNNPALAPVFSLLDNAQRNNSVASLTAEDVQGAVGGRSEPPVVNVTTPGSEQLAESIIGMTDSQERLNELLDAGIIAVMATDQAYKELKKYQRLKDNAA